MTKSAVRAMDTVTSVVLSTSGNALTVDKFVVAGGSKRGWTTWTTVGSRSRELVRLSVKSIKCMEF